GFPYCQYQHSLSPRTGIANQYWIITHRTNYFSSALHVRRRAHSGERDEAQGARSGASICKNRRSDGTAIALKSAARERSERVFDCAQDKLYGFGTHHERIRAATQSRDTPCNGG